MKKNLIYEIVDISSTVFMILSLIMIIVSMYHSSTIPIASILSFITAILFLINKKWVGIIWLLNGIFLIVKLIMV